MSELPARQRRVRWKIQQRPEALNRRDLDAVPALLEREDPDVRGSVLSDLGTVLSH